MVAASPTGTVVPLAAGERFTFACHPGVPCFTECCRLLDLVLSPYDVLRLKRGLQLTSMAFLDRYALIEPVEGATFPLVYLAMEEDDQGRCPFVSADGCRVYPHRPAACRLYPVARGTSLQNGRVQRRHLLVREPHCRGFDEPVSQDLDRWTQSQELAPYEEYETVVLRILQHERLRQGWRPTEKQLDTVLTALYNLDQFRIDWQAGLGRGNLPATDEELLVFAVDWLEDYLFGP